MLLWKFWHIWHFWHLFVMMSAWCHQWVPCDDAAADVGADLEGWRGSQVEWTMKWGITHVPTWFMTWGVETEDGKWFYWTAFCMGAVCVRGGQMQWKQDTHLLYDGKTTAPSDANSRMLRWFRNRWEPSHGEGPIRWWTALRAAGIIIYRASWILYQLFIGRRFNSLEKTDFMCYKQRRYGCLGNIVLN